MKDDLARLAALANSTIVAGDAAAFHRTTEELGD